MMINSIFVFLGAGIGGVIRFWFSSFIYFYIGKQFHYATVMINVSGCCLMGLFFVLLEGHFFRGYTEIRAFLLIGLLGGYTTFSAFSMEIIQLLEQGDFYHAGANLVLSVILCLVANGIGGALGRWLLKVV